MSIFGELLSREGAELGTVRALVRVFSDRIAAATFANAAGAPLTSAKRAELAGAARTILAHTTFLDELGQRASSIGNEHSIERLAAAARASGPRAQLAQVQRNAGGSAQLAKALRCSRAMVDYVLKGQRCPGLRLALRIEDAYGIPARSWVEAPPRTAQPEAEIAPTSTPTAECA